jgi:hypothetical protein
MELASKLPVPPLKWSSFVMAGQSAKRGFAPDIPATGILLFRWQKRRCPAAQTSLSSLRKADC